MGCCCSVEEMLEAQGQIYNLQDFRYQSIKNPFSAQKNEYQIEIPEFIRTERRLR